MENITTTGGDDHHLEIKSFISNNCIIKQPDNSNECTISVSRVPLLKLCTKHDNYQFAKILVQQYKLLPNFQVLLDAMSEVTIHTSEILELFLKDGVNFSLIKMEPKEYRALFNIIENHPLIVRNKLIQIILNSNLLQGVDTSGTTERMVSFSMFSKITDENLQVQLFERKLVDIIKEREMEEMAESIFNDISYGKLLSKGFMVYLNDQSYILDYLSTKTNQNNNEKSSSSTSFIRALLLIDMVRPKLSNNLNSILKYGGYSTVVWFINISQDYFIPLLPFKQQKQKQLLQHPFIYNGFSFNDKIEFLKECAKSIQIDNNCYNSQTIDSLIQSFYPFNGCVLPNLKGLVSLVDSLKLASFSSLCLMVKSYLSGQVIATDEINSIPQFIIERMGKDKKFSLTENEDYFKGPETMLIDKINQFVDICLLLETTDRIHIELLSLFLMVKSKFKQFIVKNYTNKISSSLVPFITKIQYGGCGVGLIKDQKLLKVILSNYNELFQFLGSINLIQLLESLILFKYSIKIIKILFQILQDQDHQDYVSNTIPTSLKVVGLILVNNEKDEYYRQLLKLSFINHKFIIWDDELVSPLSFKSINDNNSTPDEETITNLFKSYKLNNNISRYRNSNILDMNSIGSIGSIGDSSGSGSSSARSGKKYVKRGIKSIKTFKPSSLNSLFDNFSIYSDISSSTPTLKQYDIHNLIIIGQIYKAFDILVENKGNWFPFKFNDRETIKILKYCEMDVIEQFSRFFNDTDFTLRHCNNRIDVYQFLIAIK